MTKSSQHNAKWRRWLAGHHIRQHRSLQFLGTRLHDINLWRFNRYSTSMGAAIGLFVCFIPIPMQMLVAAIFGFLCRANLVLSVALVWISNPITMGPMLFICYKLGRYFLNTPALITSDWSFAVFWNNLNLIWQPLLLGCFIARLASGCIGFILIQIAWRFIAHHFPSDEEQDHTHVQRD